MTSSPQESRTTDPDLEIDLYKRDVDITLIRENLKLTHEERLIKLIELQRLAGELRRAGREARARDTAREPASE